MTDLATSSAKRRGPRIHHAGLVKNELEKFKMYPHWIVLRDGFGCQIEPTYLRWIFWVQSHETQEGLLVWGQETLGVVPWREDGPRHMIRPSEEIVADLLNAGILDTLKAEVKSRTEKPSAEKLFNELFAECPHRGAAMLLAKGPIRPGWEKSVPQFWRHNCSNYDATLRQGGDRLTETLRVHNDLIEVMRFVAEHKSEILALMPGNGPLEYFQRLAQLDQEAVITAALEEVEARRAA